MIFDLTSPGRKTAVRIIFGFLAFIFAAGFIFLGIGTEGGFNPFDSAGGGSTDDAFEQQIEDAEEAVEKDPNDPDALVNLVVLRAPVGRRASSDRRGDPAARRAHGRLARGVRGGDLRLAGLPGRRAEEGQRRRGRRGRPVLPLARRLRGRDRRAAELAKSDPSGPNFSALAQLLYFNLQIEAADKARDQALAEANAETKKLLTTAARAASKAGGQGGGGAEEAAGLRERRRLRARPTPSAASARPIPPRELPDPRYDRWPPGPLAQLVEQETLNLKVRGSIPLRPTFRRRSG